MNVSTAYPNPSTKSNKVTRRVHIGALHVLALNGDKQVSNLTSLP